MVEGVAVEQEAPEETGDPIKDMDNYRNHHGMDRVFQYLLQTLIMEEPEDPVAALLAKVESLPMSFAELRQKLGNQPYQGKI